MSAKTPVEVVLGTHTVGSVTERPGIAHFDNDEDVNAFLDAFYSRGYRHIDTSRMYSGSEERLGRVGAASRFVIDTKILSGAPGAHEPEKVAASIAQSLAELKTSQVENLFLHIPDRQTPFADSARAMNDAYKKGQFRKFGLSNYTAAEVQQFLEICEREGYVKPTVYQGQYNPVVRGGEEELFPLLRKHGLTFMAYSPAAGGLFTGNSGKSATSSRWSDSNPIGKLYKTTYGSSAVQDSVALVQDAAQKHDISGHAAAVRWTAYHSLLDGSLGDAIVFTGSKISQVQNTLDAIEAGPLPQDLADAIAAVYATVKGSEPPYHH